MYIKTHQMNKQLKLETAIPNAVYSSFKIMPIKYSLDPRKTI